MLSARAARFRKKTRNPPTTLSSLILDLACIARTRGVTDECVTFSTLSSLDSATGGEFNSSENNGSPGSGQARQKGGRRTLKHAKLGDYRPDTARVTRAEVRIIFGSVNFS